MTQANATLSPMRRSTFQLRTYQRLPVQCSVFFHNDHLQGTGTLWNLSRDGCRIDANVFLHGGTVVELLIVLPGPSSAILVKAASVCWKRGLECGLRLVLLQPGEAAHLERYITQTISEAPHAQYPSR